MTTERAEDYLKTLAAIIKGKGYAQVKDVSKILGVGASSVTEMFQKLSEAGYINYEKYGGVTLTAKGKKIAEETKEKYTVLRKFLLILGVKENTADEDACKIEHIAKPETIDKLAKFVKFVHQPKEEPRWLDHFKYFYETGEYVECTPKNEENCPVHGKRGSKIEK
ncbi:MAG: metal-dependent transcriptional regulator [Candidatus Wukongarchaeota archaeon]|nr:metal-dependent transcriptional regulator [Candidatus Wukongarchaeota archaeon]